MNRSLFIALFFFTSTWAHGYHYPRFQSCCPWSSWKPLPGHSFPKYQPKPVYGVPSFQPHHQNYHNDFNVYKSHGFSQNLIQPSHLAHHKVLEASAHEAQLPAQLLNPFYKNPAIKHALAKHSWFGPGEKPVGQIRDTDRIGRHKIFEVFSHAGFIRRR